MDTAWIDRWAIAGLLATSLCCGRSGYDILPFDATESNWLDMDWGYRQKIVVAPIVEGETLLGFPVYLSLADLGSTFFDQVAPDGRDIRLTDVSGALVPYELVDLGDVGGTGELHFRAAALSSIVNTEFFIYYGNPQVSGNDKIASGTVWDDGFLGVFHFSEAPDNDGGCGLDRACNSAEAQSPGIISDDLQSAAQEPGLVGGSLRFDGRDDYVVFDTLSNTAFPQVQGSLTVLFQADCDASQSANDSQLIDSYSESSGRAHLFMRCNLGLPGANFQVVATRGIGDPYVYSTSLTLRTNDWNTVTLTYDTAAGTMSTFFNGEPIAIEPISNWSPSGQIFTVGHSGGGSLLGAVDEVRLSGVSRSESWIAAQYKNLYASGSFYEIMNSQTPTEE